MKSQNFTPRITATLAMVLLLSLACYAKTFRLTGDPSIPSASGKVETHHDKNGNTKLDVEVEHLAKPEKLTPDPAQWRSATEPRRIESWRSPERGVLDCNAGKEF
jgi:hypothetical protein